ncbi:hypothetical protein DPMN_164106 [Dreissena polymorpha]|uniref:Uncharacterized protein n=1 Tax=Dreissena polymorpha TaxID=45954 RepID=A0A9D4EUJ3_DREPO|nr:hypothetical protein DPMN_164106 [Dreissena polymorpha]
MKTASQQIHYAIAIGASVVVPFAFRTIPASLLKRSSVQAAGYSTATYAFTSTMICSSGSRRWTHAERGMEHLLR